MSRRQKPDHTQLFNNLSKEFHELVTNKQAFRSSIDKFLMNLIDDMTLGIIFDTHRKHKTNAFDLDARNCANADVNEEIFCHTTKKTQDCLCPICDKAVGASRFAPHLEKCMGMGRSRSRNARRGVANSHSKERDNTNYVELVSDDEDADWNPRDKRKKKKDRNGKKKKGTPKKGGDSESSDHVNVDVEGDEEELTNFRDILQDHSNSSSPAESVSSSQSNPIRKRDKNKNKKGNRKDRVSPCINANHD